MAQPIPEGYSAVTPYLCFRDTAAAIEFYKQAFGAEDVARLPGPDGTGVVHAEIKIGGAHIMMGDEFPGSPSKMRSPDSLGGVSGGVHLYVEDVDAVFEQAVAAGATVQMPCWDAFWGDRMCRLSDPFGHEWSIGTHTEDLSLEQIAERAKQFYASMAKGA